MEFFEETDAVDSDVLQLQGLLTISSMPHLCASISEVLSDDGDSGVIYCLWGEFTIHREALKYGIRFSMPACPNALAWTITRGLVGSLVIHCTIDKRDHDEDFIDSIEEFVLDWKNGLNQALEGIDMPQKSII
jgi:hypothetical protein